MLTRRNSETLRYVAAILLLFAPLAAPLAAFIAGGSETAVALSMLIYVPILPAIGAMVR